MKQARRAYRHLPTELHEQGYDQAAVALRTAAAPSALDRRSLYAELARHLDEELQRIHGGWCLNQSRVSPTAPVDAPPGTQQSVTAFLEEGLGGLERAVLQLEIGAGRDTSTVRAALRLGPRQYARHRELGLGKLRGAIAGGLNGRVCDQHLESVTMAATGDRDAAERLASGPGRCRSCAREATALQRLLQQRLALAPWPLAIKPLSALAAKAGSVGALFGGKSIAGGGLASGASGAKVVAALMATAAVASGGMAALDSDEPSEPTALSPAAEALATAPTAVNGGARAAAATPAAKRTSTPSRGSVGSGWTAEQRKAAAAKGGDAAKAAPAGETQAGSAPETQTGSKAPVEPQSKPADTVRETVDGVGKTVDGVGKTVDEVAGKVPVVPEVDQVVPQVVDETVPEVGKAVDEVKGAADGVLTP
jgi:hypothetical protein